MEAQPNYNLHVDYSKSGLHPRVLPRVLRILIALMLPQCHNRIYGVKSVLVNHLSKKHSQ